MRDHLGSLAAGLLPPYRSKPSMHSFLWQMPHASSGNEISIWCLYLIAAGLFVLKPASAQERSDTRLILEQGVERRALDRERELLKDEVRPPVTGRPVLTIDGKTFHVERTANALGQALYLSLQRQQWEDAQAFLTEYLALPDRDPLLVHYAQGALARVRGNLDQAQAEYRALLGLRPDFLPGRLELARVLFEDAQEREAEEAFSEILASIDAGDPKTAGVRKTIEAYRSALEQRSGWNGTFSLGPTWTDNVNRTSASRTCLVSDSSGFCYYERALPDAIRASGLDFDASAQKRIPLVGHHGAYVRSLVYGKQYRDYGEYNETTLITQTGYSYRTARHQAALAPSFEMYQWGNDTLYGAWGLHGEWSYMLSPRSLIKLEGDYKDLRYRQEIYAKNFDGSNRSIYATYFHEVGSGWTLFGGLDFVDSEAKEDTNAYLQKGVRLGASLQLPSGFIGTLFASYRHRDYGAYSPLFEARREDDEQNYTLIVKAPRWQIAGFVPSITYRCNKVKSNVDWLYSYDRNDVSLKMEYTF